MDTDRELNDPSKVLLAGETYRVVGAAMEVYYKLGPGFLEPVYQQALGIELGRRRVPSVAQGRFRIEYKGVFLEKEYVADFVCFDKIIIEIKALNQLSTIEWSQVINYLKVSHMRVGLLFNFGSAGRLEWKKFVI
jgi:GxxExxY protein